MWLPFAGPGEVVPCSEITFELRRGRQLLSGRRPIGFRDRRTAAVVDAGRRLDAAALIRILTVWHRQYRIQQRKAPAKRQRARGRPIDRRLQTTDTRTARVSVDNDAVRSLVGKLEVLPVLFEDRTIDAERVAQPTGLPTQLVIQQSVGLVLRSNRVGSTGTESLRCGRIDQPLIVELVGGGKLRR